MSKIGDIEIFCEMVRRFRGESDESHIHCSFLYFCCEVSESLNCAIYTEISEAKKLRNLNWCPYQYTKAVGEGNVVAHSVIESLAEMEKAT